jgi:hypothetical protein
MLTSSAGLTRQAPLELAGSPVFTEGPLNACRGSAPRQQHTSLTLMAVVLLPSPSGERVGCFVRVQCRGYVSHALVCRPTLSLSTLRLVRYRTRRQTRSLTAGEAVSGAPSQTTGPSALARRNSHTTGQTGHVSGGSVDSVRVSHHPNRSVVSRWASREFIPDVRDRPTPRQMPSHRSTSGDCPLPPFRPSARSRMLLCPLLTSAGRSGRIAPPAVLSRTPRRSPVVSCHTVRA